jgi:hypothetical protein
MWNMACDVMNLAKELHCFINGFREAYEIKPNT